MVNLVTLFATTALSIDQLIKEPAVIGLIKLVIGRLNPSYINDMQIAILDSMNTLLILWSTAPGSSCYSLGVRAGATVKKLLNVSIEDALKNATLSNNTTNTTSSALYSFEPSMSVG